MPRGNQMLLRACAGIAILLVVAQCGGSGRLDHRAVIWNWLHKGHEVRVIT